MSIGDVLLRQCSVQLITRLPTNDNRRVSSIMLTRLEMPMLNPLQNGLLGPDFPSPLSTTLPLRLLYRPLDRLPLGPLPRP